MSGRAVELAESSLDDDADAFRRDVVAGLSRRRKRLPSKYLYDRRGSELFERICDLEEYYPTRTELAIMEAGGAEMAEHIGPRCLLIEPGAGSTVKVRLLLRHLEDPAGYVPVDISAAHMVLCARSLVREFPDLRVLPVHADFTRGFVVPRVDGVARRAIYFPGSTIGNFTPEEAVALLGSLARIAEPGGALLLGFDRRKDVTVLEAAYNDSAGVTREFNLNVLSRMRRELGADVRVDRFAHRAFFNERMKRIEMHLVSRVDQTIRIDGVEIGFAAGETIHTENSYKYEPAEIRRLAAAAGWRAVADWTDPRGYFGIQYCQRP